MSWFSSPTCAVERMEKGDFSSFCQTILWNMSGYLDSANLAITVTTSDTAAPAGKTKEGLTHLIHVHLTFPQSITVSSSQATIVKTGKTRIISYNYIQHKWIID